jgi:hypothetical protein
MNLLQTERKVSEKKKGIVVCALSAYCSNHVAVLGANSVLLPHSIVDAVERPKSMQSCALEP